MHKSEAFRKLIILLKELFQLDRPDLDFGFYRIMHAKSVEVTEFLERDLLPQVQAAFAQYQSADKAAIEKELDETVKRIQSDGADPDTSPKVRDLRTRLAEEAVDLNALEAEIYDHLYSFFRRYYSEGDFLSKRVYKPGVYAIPYEGEEVKLHWANADQYYIKTSEYLRHYTFRLRPEDDEDPMRVHFRLVDAVEGEHGNVKAAEDKKRVFLLRQTDFIADEDSGQGTDRKELVIRFEYRPATLADWPEDERKSKSKPPAQKNLVALAERRVREAGKPELTRWIEALNRPHVTAEGEQTDYSCLRVHLNRYTARNTFDYFIHKDLDGFLARELDFYIKNEVMHLDDVESETALRVEQYISKIKVIRRIGAKIIDFLAQLEDFQKKLWLKRKFVVETSWCIRLGCVPEEFHAEIAANGAQREEWVRLFAIDLIDGDLDTPSYGVPLDPEFLSAYPTLVVDTQHFPSEFTERLLEAIGDMDEQTDGVLFHSENFQALSAMQARYRERVECVYIDPPYNTGDSEILYKNGYLRSSWLSLMSDRLQMLPSMFTQDPMMYIAIDDFEMTNLAKLVDTEYPQFHREMIIINHHPQGGKAKTLAHTHEYMLACMPISSDRSLARRMSDDSAELRPFKRSGTADSNFRRSRPNSFYAILIDPDSRRVIGLEPPPKGFYPTGKTKDGFTRIYPIGKQGEERVWRRSYESCQKLNNDQLRCTENSTIYQVIEAKDRKAALFSNWVDSRYNAGTHGANLLRDILGEQNPFPYPKSVHAVSDAIFVAGFDNGTHVLDFFAGSGTTGHAVINLNREDDGRRKFILVEMGDYFDTVLLPRIKKVTFAPEWKDGRPKRPVTPEEAERSPRIVKVVRLESYEDTLNNLEPRRSDEQQNALDTSRRQGQGQDAFREQYLLRYMLDVETRGSPSLLSLDAFTDPTSYRLKVKRPGSDESQEVNVDLLETFNWLIGLQVRHIASPCIFNANFKRDQEGRLQLRGQLRRKKDGPWWFRTLTGTTPDGRKALVIWRKRPGGETAEGIEQDSLVLNEWFAGQGYGENGSHDLIYVNGDNNLENLKASDDLWTVRLIEEDFHRLMFEPEEA